jgi:hypothetical protein
MLKTSTLAFVGAAVGCFLSASAFALPAAPLDLKGGSDLVLVADGCGPGYHRNPWGHCKPNLYPTPYGFYPAPYRVCPWGWHYSPFRGGCRPNW